jgi:predicted AlkP superfamily pyrophosphatase or phosphodiesterase
MARAVSRLAQPLLLSGLCLAGCARGPQGGDNTAASMGASAPFAAPSRGLRLVVQITVDQLRADLPERVLTRVAEGGFKRFYQHGVVYDRANYAHAITETAPGHATLFTGGHPREHGIVGNEWLSPMGEAVPVVEDTMQPLLTPSGKVKGVSPHNMLLPTIGDALRAQTQNQALVFGVSEKDRGAVLPAGKTGKAFWLDDDAGAFVSSAYYMPQLPTWLSACSESLEVRLLRGQRWRLMQDEARYSVADDLASEASGAGEARTFPHAIDAAETRALTRQVKRTPYADELVLDFVRELLTHEPLGRDDVPDLLAVSFSATDYVGHTYGPESREAEDNLLRLDRTLAALFELLERRVGLERTLVILSADHGISESPEWLRSQGKPAGRHDTQAMVRDLNRDLRAAFKVEVDLVRGFVNPSLWLDEDSVAKAKLTVGEVASRAAALLRTREGVAAAFARDDVLADKLETQSLGAEGERIGRLVRASVHPERSGHVYVVPNVGWLLAADASQLTAMHGTPWPYDTHVPIWVLAPGISAQRVQREVDPRAIAPTIARWVGVSNWLSVSDQLLIEALPPARTPR